MFKISAVIPTIGRVVYLDKSIDSVIDQSIKFDQIVVFDNSQDQNLQTISSHGNNDLVTWVRSGGNLNPIDSWNTAVSYCNEEYVTIVGDDDILLNNFVFEIKKCLQRADFVSASFHLIDSKDEKLTPANLIEADMTADVFRKNRMQSKIYLVIPGNVFKKKHFLDVGGFSASGLPNYLYSDDLLWFKITALSSKVATPEMRTWSYRRHEGQIGNLRRLKNFTHSINTYINKIENIRINMGIESTSFYPVGMNSHSYANKLIKERFFNIVAQLIKKKNYTYVTLNIVDILSSKIYLIDKIKVLIHIYSGLMNKLVRKHS